MKIGLIGLGLMGTQIVSRLIEKGYNVNVYNRDRSKLNYCISLGAQSVDTPKELARSSDFIIISVTDFNAVKAVSFESDGIVQAEKGCKIVANLSTISPKESDYCGQMFIEKKIEMLSMPVMGGPSAAQKGELVPIISGSQTAFEKIQPVISKISKSFFYIGHQYGMANAVKLALNLNIAILASAVAEGILLVQSYGVDPFVFLKVLNSTYFKTGLSEIKGPKMANNDFEPSFHLKNMLKDVSLAEDTARSLGIALPITSNVEQLYRAANRSGYSDKDYTAILAFLQQINNSGAFKKND